MKIPWLRSGLCRRTRDRLLDQLSAPVSGVFRPDPPGARRHPPPGEFPEEMTRHLERCADCAALAAALPAVARWAPQWAAAEPPAGLAQQTALRLLPFWSVRERAVNRQEVRMIWSSGLAMAAASIVAILFVLDGLFPVDPAAGHHPLMQVGLLVGATQLIGGGLLSLTLLILDTRRKRAGAEARAKAERGGAGEPSSPEGGAEGGQS